MARLYDHSMGLFSLAERKRLQILAVIHKNCYK